MKEEEEVGSGHLIPISKVQHQIIKQQSSSLSSSYPLPQPHPILTQINTREKMK